jgi:ABC-type enterobactin transport system permease subunit
MTNIELLIWILALAIAIHTITESSVQQIVAGHGLSVLRDRAVWLDNLPIFIALILGAVLGSYRSLFAGSGNFFRVGICVSPDINQISSQEMGIG